MVPRVACESEWWSRILTDRASAAATRFITWMMKYIMRTHIGIFLNLYYGRPSRKPHHTLKPAYQSVRSVPALNSRTRKPKNDSQAQVAHVMCNWWTCLRSKFTGQSHKATWWSSAKCAVTIELVCYLFVLHFIFTFVSLNRPIALEDFIAETSNVIARRLSACVCHRQLTRARIASRKT